MIAQVVRIAVEIAVLAAVYTLASLSMYNLDSYKRGFYCDDESIRYPYKSSTVSSNMLYGYAYGLPLATIVVVECLRKLFPCEDTKSEEHFVLRIYRHALAFLFGFASTELLTDFGKKTIGRLRPHFYDVCTPNVNCDDPALRNKYIVDFKCLTGNEYHLKDMRLSFPSGHSSIAAYSMLFLVLYCTARITWKDTKWAKHIVQLFAVTLALYTGLTRVSDYKHHWSDVLAGLVLGAAIALWIVMYVAKLFPRDEVKVEEPSPRHEDAARMPA